MIMNKIKTILAFTFLLSIFACTNPKAFKLTVKASDDFPSSAEVVIYKTVLDPKNEAFGTDSKKIYSGAFVNGVFECSGVVEAPYTIFFNVRAKEGSDKYPPILKNFRMVIEPGETVFQFHSLKDYELRGGRLNDLVVNSWRKDKGYQKALKDLTSFADTLSDADFKDRKIFKQYVAYNSKLAAKKNEALLKAFDTATDLEKVYFYMKMRPDVKDGFKQLDFWDTVTAPFLKTSEEAQIVFQGVKSRRASLTARNQVMVGKVIKDFTAQDLQGRAFHLKEVLKQHKYVLVEFWASWCSPCRAEIPYLKKAYKAFHEKSFEIVSFSLDHQKEAWEKASAKEQLPWINTGDLKAWSSPVATMYGVRGVPANFLVEASTGRIIAKDLRGHKLDEKLKELLH